MIMQFEHPSNRMVTKIRINVPGCIVSTMSPLTTAIRTYLLTPLYKITEVSFEFLVFDIIICMYVNIYV